MKKRFQKKRVLLLIGGGTSLLLPDGGVSEIHSAKDVGPWLRRIPELTLIASVEPVFLYIGAPFEKQPAWWERIAVTIAKRFRSVDGFIVTQPIEAIPYSAAALSLMLGKMGKPVVITGSPELPTDRNVQKKLIAAWQGNAEIGIRANLVNAAQVATQDIGEIAVIFGNRLLRAGTIIRHAEPSLNIFESAGIAPLGRVDFGLKLEPHRRRRTTTVPKLLPKLKTRILHIPIGPTTASLTVPSIDPESIDGILLSGMPVSAPAELVEPVLGFAETAHVPVAVYSHWPIRHAERYLTISGVTASMAMMKFMWALGNAREKKAQQKLLDVDRSGEVFRLEKHRP